MRERERKREQPLRYVPDRSKHTVIHTYIHSDAINSHVIKFSTCALFVLCYYCHYHLFVSIHILYFRLNYFGVFTIIYIYFFI